MTDEFIRALQAKLGSVTTLSADVPERFLSDWSGLAGVRPLALIRPRTTQDVSDALAICSRFKVPVVPQGGLTGLAGGASPVVGGVALSLDLLTGIEEIDPVMATVTAWAGTPLRVIQEAAEEAGLFLGLDLGARDSCTIGGNLATNAGGNRVIRYGMARDHVLGIEVVLPNGVVLTALNKMLKNNAGYDLKQLFIGTEGTLGIVTRVVLRLQARPSFVANAFCACPDFKSVLGLLTLSRRRLGSCLSSFEAMWPSFYDFMTGGLPTLRRPFTQSHGAYVLIEASGFGPIKGDDWLQDVLAEALNEGFLSDALIAQSEREARELWAVRESVSEYGRLMGPLTAFDIGLPTSEMGGFVEAVDAGIKSQWPDAIALAYGHIGDSNLHLVCNVPSAGMDQPHDAIAALVYGAVRRVGGTISAEHGIGLLKKAYLAYSRTPVEIELMKSIKAMLDPGHIINPGKILSF